MERILLKNVLNIRDLGGFTTKDNKKIRYNKIIRSSLIQTIDKEEIDNFVNKNILTVIDLRDSDEIKKKNNALSLDKRFKYNNIPLKGKDFPKLEKDIAKGYINIIDDKDSVYKVIKIIMNSNNGVIFSCNSGKDRTGMISMLLLLICGVPDKDIIADYEISYIYLKDEIEKFHQDNPKLPKFIGKSKSEYMEKTLELFYKKYQCIEKYMNYIGFDNNEIQRLREKLLN